MLTETKVKTFRQELFEAEPKTDLLHDLSGFGRFIEVKRSSDGYFLGRRRGEIGFNSWLGNPSISALARTKDLMEKLSPEKKAMAKAVLRRFRIFM